MKGKYFAAAGVALVSVAVYYFFRKRNSATTPELRQENERHHLTNAFSKAKQVAVGRDS